MSRAGSRALASVLSFATVIVAPRARADVRVERSDGADSCPDNASFATRMRDAAPAPSSAIRDVTVRFERTPNGYRSSVLTSDGRHRTLADDASSCDGLAEATILAVKLALDPSEPPAAPASAPIATAPPPTREAVSPPPVRRSTVGVEVLAGGILTVGIGSPVAPGACGGAALTLGDGRSSIGVTCLALSAQTREVGEGTVDISVAGGGIEGCGRARVGRPVLLALCGRAEVMSLAGTAQGFARVENRARPLFAGTVLGRARVQVAGPVTAFLETGVVVPVVRERFAIDRVGVVYDPPIVAGTAGIGVLVDFE